MFGDLWFRVRSLLSSRRAEADLAEELQFHLDCERQKLEHTGLDAAEAQRRSLVAFGGVSSTTEACRDARGVGVLTDISKDVRYGWRSPPQFPQPTKLSVVCSSCCPPPCWQERFWRRQVQGC